MSEFEDKWVVVNDLRLHYLDWGNHDAQPMVLFHGLCSHARYWDFFAQSARSDYHILALDHRGHGESSWAEDYGPRYYVHDLEAFVAYLGLKDIVLIGHSLGGINAALYAARHPEEVAKLVMVDIGPEISRAGVERMQREQASEPEAFSSEDEVIRYLHQSRPRQSVDFVTHHARYAVRQDEKGRFMFKCDPRLQSSELRSPEWLWEYLEQIVCATLVVHGEESDLLSPEVAQRMVDTLPFGFLVEVDGAGHSIPGDNPDGFERAVREFLFEKETHITS